MCSDETENGEIRFDLARIYRTPTYILRILDKTFGFIWRVNYLNEFKWFSDRYIFCKCLRIVRTKKKLASFNEKYSFFSFFVVVIDPVPELSFKNIIFKTYLSKWNVTFFFHFFFSKLHIISIKLSEFCQLSNNFFLLWRKAPSSNPLFIR